MSNITINEIFIKICNKNDIYYQIIENIISPNIDQVDAVISELADYWLNNPKGVLKAWNENYFKYYFIMAVKNQVHSSTSSFHKNNRPQSNVDFMIEDMTIEDKLIDDTPSSLNSKIVFEEDLQKVMVMLGKIDITWFQSEMFKSYYFKDMTYRKIQEEYGMDNHVIVFEAVDIVRKKLIEGFEK